MPLPPVKKSIVEAFLREHPNLPNRTAAKQIAEQYPDTFTVESARKFCRSIRGVNGDHKGNHGVAPVSDLALEWSKMRAQLPEPTTYDFSPVKPTCSAGRFLVLSDIHVPFHSNVAIEAAVRKGREDDIDAIILNGDIWDCVEGSVFSRPTNHRDLTSEAFAARQFFAYLREAFPAAEIIYKIGNHEERWMKHFSRQFPGTSVLLEKTGRKNASIASVGGLLELSDFNVHTIESRRPILLGKYLYILHGHEAGGSSYAPVSPARTIYLKAGVCAIVAHNHRTSQHVERNMDGREIVTHSQGHLADPTPEYAPLNRWNWGFARVDLASDGGFRVWNYRISHKGEVWS
jgi:predicted phosphodiesterase